MTTPSPRTITLDRAARRFALRHQLMPALTLLGAGTRVSWSDALEEFLAIIIKSNDQMEYTAAMTLTSLWRRIKKGKELRMVQFVTLNGLLYADLGNGDFAKSLTAYLESKYGGHHVYQNGRYLYFNGAATEDIYLDMISKAIEI